MHFHVLHVFRLHVLNESFLGLTFASTMITNQLSFLVMHCKMIDVHTSMVKALIAKAANVLQHSDILVLIDVC